MPGDVGHRPSRLTKWAAAARKPCGPGDFAPCSAAKPLTVAPAMLCGLSLVPVTKSLRQNDQIFSNDALAVYGPQDLRVHESHAFFSLFEALKCAFYGIFLSAPAFPYAIP